MVTITTPPSISPVAQVVRRGVFTHDNVYERTEASVADRTSGPRIGHAGHCQEIVAGARLGDAAFATLHAITHFSVKKLNRMIEHDIADGLPHSSISAAGRTPCTDCLEGRMRKPTVGSVKSTVQRLRDSHKQTPTSTATLNKFEEIGLDVIDNGKGWKIRRYTLVVLDFGPDKIYLFHFGHKSDFKEKGIRPLLSLVAGSATVSNPQPLKVLQSDSDKAYWTPAVKQFLPMGAPSTYRHLTRKPRTVAWRKPSARFEIRREYSCSPVRETQVQ